MFFFEKKNQKTRDCFAWCNRTLLQAVSINVKSFLLLFFKKEDFFPC